MRRRRTFGATARNLCRSGSGAKHDIPRYSCWRGLLDNGEPRCIAFGGLRVDDAIEDALLRVVEPGAIAAAAEAEAQAASRRDQVREALLRDLEAARYHADRAFRQYDAADPANRLVAAELETRWNRTLVQAEEIEARIAQHDAATPRPSSLAEIDAATLGANLRTVWAAPTTDALLNKLIIRTVIHEVVADIDDEASEIKSMQPAVTADLREISHAGTRAAALATIETFKEKYGAKYARGVTCVTKDTEALLACLTTSRPRTGTTSEHQTPPKDAPPDVPASPRFSHSSTFNSENAKLARQCAAEGKDHAQYLLRLGRYGRDVIADVAEGIGWILYRFADTASTVLPFPPHRSVRARG